MFAKQPVFELGLLAFSMLTSDIVPLEKYPERFRRSLSPTSDEMGIFYDVNEISIPLDTYPRELRDFLHSLLACDPARRPTINDAVRQLEQLRWL